MRILHTSDWHLGKSLEGISRIDEQREFIDFLCDTASQERIDLVLIAGDIYDTYNPPALAEELFYEAIERLNDKGRRAVLVISGNHDNPERLCAASPLANKNGILLLGYPSSDPGELKSSSGSIRVVRSGQGWLELSIEGCSHHAVILTLPYPSESRLEEVLSDQNDEAALQRAYSEKVGSIFHALEDKFRKDTVNLIVSHLFVRGGRESESERTLQVGGALTVDPSVFPAGCHYAALGHLHRPQQMKSAPCPTFYSGSPLAYSFSEAEHSKAVYIVEAVPGQEASVTPLYLSCGKPLRRWIATEGYEQALRWCEEGRDANAWVDLEITTDKVLSIEEQKHLRSLHPGIVFIRPRLLTGEIEVLAPESREGRRIDELFSDYFKYRTGTQITEELMAAFLEIVNDSGEEDEHETQDS